MHKEGLANVKIQSLQEEIEYLKKHYQIEMDVFKQENKMLRQRCNNMALHAEDQSMEMIGQ